MSPPLTLKQARRIIWTLAAGLMVIIVTQGVHIVLTPLDMTWTNNIDGMYEASATILALVGFGSTIGVKISTNKLRASIQLAGLLLVFGGSITIIMAQVFIMIGLCCLGLSQLSYIAFLLWTGVALLVMLLGYLALVLQQQMEDDVDAAFKRETSDKIRSFAATNVASEYPTTHDVRSQHSSKAPVPWRGLRS